MSNENKEKKQEITVSSLMPNLRFGTSFLDTKYRDRAALGETLMDKRTGEIALNRKTDGSFIYFDREQPKLDDYFLEISQLIKSNLKFTFPELDDEDQINKGPSNINVHFMTTLIDTHNFRSEFDNIENSMNIGAILFNDSDDSFSFSRFENGFFIKVKARPRDIPLLDFYGMIYNNYIENYDGDNQEIKDQKKLLNDNSYKYGNVKITYTITPYIGQVPGNSVTKTAYIRTDENVLLTFPDLFNSGNYSFLTLRIDSIQFWKLKSMREELLFSNDKNTKIYNYLLDDPTLKEDIMAVTHIYVSYFNDLNLEPLQFPSNARVISSMPLKVFEESFSMVDNLSSSGGIHISPGIPDDLTLSRITLWVERLRNVGEKGITTSIQEPPETDPIELENFFGQCENLHIKFTPSTNNLNDIYVSIGAEAPNYILGW